MTPKQGGLAVGGGGTCGGAQHKPAQQWSYVTGPPANITQRIAKLQHDIKYQYIHIECHVDEC